MVGMRVHESAKECALFFSEEELNRFYRYCIALTQNEAEAKDLLQESIRHFISRPSSTKVVSPVKYLLQVIRNQFIDFLRAANRSPFDEVTEKDLEVIHIDWKTIEDVLIEREDVRRIFAMLRPDERELLFLWAVEEYTVKEIAEHSSTPVGTLLSKLHRIRKKIQQLLENELNNESELKAKS